MGGRYHLGYGHHSGLALIFRNILKRLSFSDHNLDVVLAGISLSHFSTLLCLGPLVSVLNGRQARSSKIGADRFAGLGIWLGRRLSKGGTKVRKKGNVRLR